MPLDTRNKRASAIGFAAPYRAVLPDPDGTIDQADRQQLAYSYPGILVEIPPQPTPGAEEAPGGPRGPTTRPRIPHGRARGVPISLTPYVKVDRTQAVKVKRLEEIIAGLKEEREEEDADDENLLLLVAAFHQHYYRR